MEVKGSSWKTQAQIMVYYNALFIKVFLKYSVNTSHFRMLNLKKIVKNIYFFSCFPE